MNKKTIGALAAAASLGLGGAGKVGYEAGLKADHQDLTHFKKVMDRYSCENMNRGMTRFEFSEPLEDGGVTCNVKGEGERPALRCVPRESGTGSWACDFDGGWVNIN